MEVVYYPNLFLNHQTNIFAGYKDPNYQLPTPTFVPTQPASLTATMKTPIFSFASFMLISLTTISLFGNALAAVASPSYPLSERDTNIARNKVCPFPKSPIL
jgi:hypothetical protein